MKHPSNREFFAYWDARRGDARAPERGDLEPDGVRGLLGDIFVLSCEETAGYPFRVAGTRVCALLGGDQKHSSFVARFAAADRRDITTILGAVADETLAAVVGLSTTTTTGAPANLELLLLPFSARPHTPLSLTGLLAPFGDPCGSLGDFNLTSWRYLAHPPQRLGPRLLRKLAVARGLMVYEGLR